MIEYKNIESAKDLHKKFLNDNNIKRFCDHLEILYKGKFKLVIDLKNKKITYIYENQELIDKTKKELEDYIKFNYGTGKI
jgi:hypothetical protein